MSELDHLDAGPVLETVRRLERRIAARFAGRGINALAVRLGELVSEVEKQSSSTVGRVHTARRVSRLLAGLVLVATLAVLALALRSALDDAGVERSLDWLPLVESAINDVVFAGIALFFLYSIPERLRRGQSLELLHRLRSLAHVIDMHQLSKDPERLREGYVATAQSLDPRLAGRQEMEHYLDYCSEMLSLVGKAAALVAENSRDPVVLDAVGDVETLTVGMSRKIWQKISVLARVAD